MKTVKEAAEAYANDHTDLCETPENRSYLWQCDFNCFIAGATYRDAEVEMLREALNYARGVYAEACALGEDRIGLSEFYTKIESILAKGEK